MYLLKNVYLSPMTENVMVENGIRATLLKNKELRTHNDFWGRTEIHLGEFADFSKFAEMERKRVYLIPYISEYEVKDIFDGFKDFYFSISTYQPDKVEGYIIFIKKARDIKTSGKKLFGRDTDEIVAILLYISSLRFSLLIYVAGIYASTSMSTLVS